MTEEINDCADVAAASDLWKRHESADVVCPFYHHDDRTHIISCEGIIPGSYTYHKFGKKTDFKKQMTKVCCGHYQECEYRYVLERYKYNSCN